MRILVDTNILVAIAEPEHVHHYASMESVEALRRCGHDLVLVPQVLYEFWTVATRPRDVNGLEMSVDEAALEVSELKGVFTLLRDERAVYTEWERIVVNYGVSGKKAHDARLVAAMVRHGVTHLLTFNFRDFTRYPQITAILPEDAIAGGVS